MTLLGDRNRSRHGYSTAQHAFDRYRQRRVPCSSSDAYMCMPGNLRFLSCLTLGAQIGTSMSWLVNDMPDTLEQNKSRKSRCTTRNQMLMKLTNHSCRRVITLAFVPAFWCLTFEMMEINLRGRGPLVLLPNSTFLHLLSCLRSFIASIAYECSAGLVLSSLCRELFAMVKKFLPSKWLPTIPDRNPQLCSPQIQPICAASHRRLLILMAPVFFRSRISKS